jgi:hypothetical protein
VAPLYLHDGALLPISRIVLQVFGLLLDNCSAGSPLRVWLFATWSAEGRRIGAAAKLLRRTPAAFRNLEISLLSRRHEEKGVGRKRLRDHRAFHMRECAARQCFITGRRVHMPTTIETNEQSRDRVLPFSKDRVCTAETMAISTEASERACAGPKRPAWKVPRSPHALRAVVT